MFEKNKLPLRLWRLKAALMAGEPYAFAGSTHLGKRPIHIEHLVCPPGRVILTPQSLEPVPVERSAANRLPESCASSRLPGTHEFRSTRAGNSSSMNGAGLKDCDGARLIKGSEGNAEQHAEKRGARLGTLAMFSESLFALRLAVVRGDPGSAVSKPVCSGFPVSITSIAEVDRCMPQQRPRTAFVAQEPSNVVKHAFCHGCRLPHQRSTLSGHFQPPLSL